MAAVAAVAAASPARVSAVSAGISAVACYECWSCLCRWSGRRGSQVWSGRVGTARGSECFNYVVTMSLLRRERFLLRWRAAGRKTNAASWLLSAAAAMLSTLHPTCGTSHHPDGAVPALQGAGLHHRRCPLRCAEAGQPDLRHCQRGQGLAGAMVGSLALPAACMRAANAWWSAATALTPPPPLLMCRSTTATSCDWCWWAPRSVAPPPAAAARRPPPPLSLPVCMHGPHPDRPLRFVAFADEAQH